MYEDLTDLWIHLKYVAKVIVSRIFFISNSSPGEIALDQIK
jgi:hypothetical protein